MFIVFRETGNETWSDEPGLQAGWRRNQAEQLLLALQGLTLDEDLSLSLQHLDTWETTFKWLAGNNSQKGSMPWGFASDANTPRASSVVPPILLWRIHLTLDHYPFQLQERKKKKTFQAPPSFPPFHIASSPTQVPRWSAVTVHRLLCPRGSGRHRP